MNLLAYFSFAKILKYAQTIEHIKKNGVKDWLGASVEWDMHNLRTFLCRDLHLNHCAAPPIFDYVSFRGLLCTKTGADPSGT